MISAATKPPRFAVATGIYFAREDVGTVDQLSFQAPFLPVAFAGEPAGSLANFFLTPPNALPKGGVLDPNFVSMPGRVRRLHRSCHRPADQQHFLGGELRVRFRKPGPRSFTVPLRFDRAKKFRRTQYPTVEPDPAAGLGSNGSWRVGYIGAHDVHLRETRTSIQARLASPTNPITLTDASGNPF